MPARPPMFRPSYATRTAPRPSAAARGYGARWRRESKEHLAANPWCVPCQRVGHRTPATMVDHVKPHKGDVQLFWDKSNWQSSCLPCNSRKAAKFEGAFGNPIRL